MILKGTKIRMRQGKLSNRTVNIGKWKFHAKTETEKHHLLLNEHQTLLVYVKPDGKIMITSHAMTAR